MRRGRWLRGLETIPNIGSVMYCMARYIYGWVWPCETRLAIFMALFCNSFTWYSCPSESLIELGEHSGVALFHGLHLPVNPSMCQQRVCQLHHCIQRKKRASRRERKGKNKFLTPCNVHDSTSNLNLPAVYDLCSN